MSHLNDRQVLRRVLTGIEWRRIVHVGGLRDRIIHREHQLAIRAQAVLEVTAVKRESLDEKRRGRREQGDTTRGPRMMQRCEQQVETRQIGILVLSRMSNLLRTN